jgi:hypothetical protein
MFVEGQKVVYAGEVDPFNEVGSLGRVVSSSGEYAAHVQWTSGPKVGQIELVDANDIVHDRNQTEALLSQSQPFLAGLQQSHPEAQQVTLPGLQVRAAYDAHGEAGAVTALDETGVLAVLATHAEEVVSMLVGKVGADAHMRAAMAGLEVDEQDVVVTRVVATLLADQLRES